MPRPPVVTISRTEIRMAGGLDVLPIDVSALRKSIEILRHGGIVGTGIDRPDPFGGGEMVSFFGRPLAGWPRSPGHADRLADCDDPL